MIERQWLESRLQPAEAGTAIRRVCQPVLILTRLPVPIVEHL